jgi:hypothetical protein
MSPQGLELDIVGPNLSLAHVGYYPRRGSPAFHGRGDLELSGPGRVNNRLTGWFHVSQADYNAEGRSKPLQWILCNTSNLSDRWSHGSVRFNSNIPFPGAPPPLEMGEFSKTNGLCQFLLTGLADTLCITEISADLVNWPPLATNNISPVGLVSIADSNSLAEVRRFFTTLARRVGVTSQISFFANAGTVYQIAVDGFALQSGRISLRLER